MPKSLKTPWYDTNVKALQLAGMSGRTRECYARAVRMLIEHFEKDPRGITEEELQEYFLFRRNVTKWSPSTLKICYCGLKFFFINVLRRDWHLLKMLKAQEEKRLPCVLSRKEVYRILGHVRTSHNKTFLTTVYSCGLRLQEALFLQVSDIDKDRMLIHVHRWLRRSIRQIIGELNRFMARWWNYFRIAESYNRLRPLPHWIRRRLRAVIWKHWKNRRTRVGELLKRGISRTYAVTTGCARKGPWRMSKVKWVNIALPDDYFTHLGLCSPRVDYA